MASTVVGRSSRTTPASTNFSSSLLSLSCLNHLFVTCLLLLSALSSYNNYTVFGFKVVQQKQQRTSLLSSSMKTQNAINHVRLPAGGRQMTSTTSLFAQIPKIDEWTILKTGAVQGTVSNHPELPDGYEITTSPLDTKKGGIKNNAIVVTASGSKYKLLTTIDNNNNNSKPTPTAAPVKKKASIKIPKPVVVKKKKKPVVVIEKAEAAAPPPKKKKIVVATEEAAAVFDSFDFNGKVVGNSKGNKIYLLVGKLIRSSSKRSQIYYAYEGNSDGNPISDNKLTVKISSFPQRLERENKNYNRISSKGRVLFSPIRGSDSCFVRKLDYISNCDSSQETKGGIPSGSSALVLESGTQNVRVYLEKSGGGLQGSELRKAAVNACRCVEAMHSSGLVWTDLKAENFVLTMPGNEVKGIDLESCVPQRGNPEDFSPEACPPEFAVAEKQGVGYDFRCEKNYDIWSLGMLLLELGTGRPYFKGKSEDTITKLLANANSNSLIDSKTNSLRISDEQRTIIEDNIDKQYLNLIQQCLQYKPSKRPSITQILLHPYFLTTGLGPISF